MKFAVLTGTGIDSIPGLDPEPHALETPFGPACYYATDNPDLIFLPRHGLGHRTPPHRIAFRANFWALHLLGVEAVLAAYAVGSLNTLVEPRELVVLTDFLDCTDGHERTFFEGGAWGVGHADMTLPYCPVLNRLMLAEAEARQVHIHPTATYACMNGPRLESPAEVKDLVRRGADVVGMTGLPEVALARELGLHFAGMALSMNLAVGRATELQLLHNLEEQRQHMLDIFLAVAANFTPAPCNCCHAVDFLGQPTIELPRSARLA